MERPAAGQQLAGRFTLQRQLGASATATVWLARDAALGDDVALKILEPRLAANPELGAALRAECQRVRRLVHPGIVRIFDLHTDRDQLFISMEFVNGGTLAELRGAGYRDVVRTVLGCCEPLRYAHAQGIVHRDLKAANVLRDASGRCRLVDFGIAGALGGAGTGSYSPSAASPQQVAGEPATVADDVYGLGALLYDLLAGRPPLHPDITPDRIRHEKPAMPRVDGAGVELPDTLVRLLAAMLDKDAALRPASIGAVRTALEGILAESSSPAAAQSPAAPLVAPAAPAGAKPGRGVYAALAMLLLVALAVIFLLPDYVARRGPLVTVPAEPPIAPAAAPAEAGPGDREVADAELARVVRADEAARAAGAERWAGADWQSARALADAGDAAYRSRDFDAAAASYRQAAGQLESFPARAQAVLEQALREGEAALRAGERAVAEQRFALALGVDPQSEAARRGQARAARLDEVLQLMKAAEARETAGDLVAARRGYESVLAVDGSWQPARDGVARVAPRLARDAFETQMARGLQALADGDHGSARPALEAALRIRPEDPGARAGLAQLSAAEQSARLSAMQSEAVSLVAAERWDAAGAKFEGMLAIDDTLVAARDGLKLARERAEIYRRLDRELARADRFNDEAIASAAKAVLADARTIEAPPGGLTDRVNRLDAALTVAAQPVPVRFESDSQTLVTIYKVGALGTFTNRTMNLRPGRYVVVGSRQGYRDVRQEIRVMPDGNAAPIVVRCEEAI